MSKSGDMTKGNPTQLLIRFAIPLLIGNVFQQLYNAVDGIIVGNFVGESAFAAVSASFPIYSIVIFIAGGLGNGISVLISQVFGYGDREQLKRAVSTTYIFIIGISFLLTILGLLIVKPALALLGGPAEIYQDSLAYLTILFFGLIATLSYNGLSSMLRATGDSRTPLNFLIIASVANIILDLIFVIVFNMGVAGVAIATIIAQALSAIFSLIYINRNIEILKVGRGDWVFDSTMLKQILSFGIPSAIQMSMVSVGILLMQNLVNSFGTSAVAAYGAANKIDSFGSMFIFSFNDSLAIYVGQNIGAGKVERAKEGLKATIRNSIVIASIMSLLIFFYGNILVKAFLGGASQQAVDISSRGLKLIAWSYPIYSIVFAFKGFLRGAGDISVIMASNILMLFIRVPVAYLLAKTSLMSNGPLLAMPISWTISSLYPIVRYFSGKWRGKAAVQREAETVV